MLDLVKCLLHQMLHTIRLGSFTPFLDFGPYPRLLGQDAFVSEQQLGGISTRGSEFVRADTLMFIPTVLGVTIEEVLKPCSVCVRSYLYANLDVAPDSASYRSRDSDSPTGLNVC